MPACRSENPSRVWSSSPPISRSSSVSPPIPSSPLSTSPPLVSPISALKRSTSNVSNSSNVYHLPTSVNTSSTPAVIVSPRRLQQSQQQHQQHLQYGTQVNYQSLPTQGQNHNRNDEALLLRILNAYFGLLLGIVRGFFNVISYAIWAPAFWVSVWVYIIWMIFQLPLTALKWFITVLHTPALERVRNKRCVLISGGSTVQAVHLARNFYKAGARVVICELEDLFGLAKYSTACSKFYTIPKPGPGNAAEYVKALKDIVRKEKAAYYIPVSVSNTAYYDALAKPYLEVMGCECFVPSASEVAILDDPMEMLRRCRALALPTPYHSILRSLEDVSRLYEQNAFTTGRYLMLAAGPAGMVDRTKIVLPPTVREFRNQQHEVSDSKPWVVIRDPSGKHYITCTTMKDSKIVANVTCLIDEERGLIPEERPEVTQWLDRFFGGLFWRINGHLSFRLVVTEEGELVPIGCRVGVSLPYICHTGVHPRLVWKPCRHFSRQNSGILTATDRHQLSDAVTSALKLPTGEIFPHLLGTVLDKREALFTYWDPLPYCVYYHLQLPFRRLAGMIRAQQHNPPLASRRRRLKNGFYSKERRVPRRTFVVGSPKVSMDDPRADSLLGIRGRVSYQEVTVKEKASGDGKSDLATKGQVQAELPMRRN